MLRETILRVGVGLVMGIGVACGGRTSMDGLEDESTSDAVGGSWNSAGDDDLIAGGTGGQSQSSTSAPTQAGGASGRTASGTASGGGPLGLAGARAGGGDCLTWSTTGRGGYQGPTSLAISVGGRPNTAGSANTGGSDRLSPGAGGRTRPIATGGDPQTGGRQSSSSAGRRSLGGRWNVGGAGGRWGAGGAGASTTTVPRYPVASPGNALLDVLPGMRLTEACLQCAEQQCPNAGTCSNFAACADAVSCVAGLCSPDGSQILLSVDCVVGCSGDGMVPLARGVQAAVCLYDRCVSDCAQ